MNGWFQSFGAPGMVKINAAWFTATNAARSRAFLVS